MKNSGLRELIFAPFNSNKGKVTAEIQGVKTGNDPHIKGRFVTHTEDRTQTSQWTSSSVSIMLWNVEGLNSILRLNPLAFLTTDIVILAETFMTQNINIEGYYNSHILATQGDRGRPSGRISCLLKPWFTPHEITYIPANILSI